MALRQVAEEVEAKRDRSTPGGALARRAVGERLLALVEPSPSAQRLVRRAWRSAQRLGAELDVLWVQPPGQAPTDEQERALAALRQLASVLGAHCWSRESDDIVGDRRARRSASAARPTS